MGTLRVLADRLRNVPLRARAWQLANEMLTPVAGRALGLIHVVEHPKCGGSWVRKLIQTYRGGDRFLADRPLRRGDVVQIHRLHRPWYWRPVVVVRDPRDLFVSFYYHETRYSRRERHLSIERHFRHEPERPLREDFAAYLEAKLVHRTHPRFGYQEFVRSWRGRPGVAWLRYEDCLADPEGELARILRAVGLPVDLQRVHEAVELNSFENATRLRTGRSRRPGEEDPTEFERKGVAGDWKNHFDARCCELIERFEGWTLRTLEYEADASWIERFLAERARFSEEGCT